MQQPQCQAWTGSVRVIIGNAGKIEQNAKSTDHSPICAPLAWSTVNVQLVGSEWSQTCSEPGRRRRARGLCCSALASRALWKRLLALFCAFLDDIFVLCQPHRVKTLYDELARCLFTFTRAKQECGTKPATNHKMSTFWALRRGTRGVVVLGTPPGRAQFVSGKLQGRVEEGHRLWEAIPIAMWVANPLAERQPESEPHIAHLPPSSSAEYGRQHDEGVWNTAVALLGQLPGTPQDIAAARSVASLPMRMGGLGLRSAARGGDAALLSFKGGRFGDDQQERSWCRRPLPWKNVRLSCM